MNPYRVVRLSGTLCLVLAMLSIPSAIGRSGGNLALDSGPPPLAAGLSDLQGTGRVTSIVPSPPQVIEYLKEKGEPLPRLDRFKASPSPVKPRKLQGTVNLLAILVDFSGTPGTVTNLTVLDNLIFAAPVSGRGSVRDYYDEVTRSTVTIATVNLPSTTGWQHASQTMAYYANNQYGMGNTFPQNAAGYVVEALGQVDPLVNFANYDNDGDGAIDSLLVIHAGTGGEWSKNPNHIQSHASYISRMGGTPPTLDGVLVDRYVTVPEYLEPGLVGPSTTDMTIGVLCHEVAHGLFGLPDLYDLDNSSAGIGQWGLMSYGDWNGPPKWNSFLNLWVTDGSSPAWPEAWSRVLLGWDSATLVMNPMSNFCLAPAETTPNTILRFKSTGLRSQEYFLAENRQQNAIPNGYDQYLPGSGLLIWHVDEAFWSLYNGPDNNNECRSLPNPHCWGACTTSHYLLSLEQADGQDHLEYHTNRGDTGDPFPGSSGNTAWQWYVHSGLSPESGTWYDNFCSTDPCIELVNITSVLPNICFDVQVAQCAAAEADLGDAPASDNNYSNTPMTAYSAPYVQAHFPTVFLTPVPAGGQGPRHHFAPIDSWLGTKPSTLEFNADQLPDQDGQANISPPGDAADLDSTLYGGDDGLLLPVPLVHCGSAIQAITLMVLYAPPYLPPPRYLNLWFDWNHDGDWGDTLTCPGGVSVPEWALPNMPFMAWQGVYPVSSPVLGHISVSEDHAFELWVRASVAEKPAPAPYDGRGPAQGYDLGETEDYYLVLSPSLALSAGVPPAPYPGQLLTYTVQFGGQGNVLAGNVIISDVLPPGIDYVSATLPHLYNPHLRTVTWPTSLTPAQPATVQLVVRVTGTPGTPITNTASLLWGDAIWKRAAFSFSIACAPGDPTADFAWPQPAYAGHTLQFTNLSTGTPPITFSWDLDGDGSIDSTDQNPTWQYATAGDYTVTLTATNASGCYDLQSKVVTVMEPRFFVYLPIILRNLP